MSEPERVSEPAAEQFEFKAEIQRVLSLVINSLYQNPEVFLRELVSNASDALDKARFLGLSESDVVMPLEGEPAIALVLDKEKRTLIIEDNGVGMTREEVVEQLGTIAKSGTAEFLARFSDAAKKVGQEQALELIGQFGVGFYAVFMVASRVDVDTRSIKRGSEPVLWRSTGEGTFSVTAGERAQHGTRITLHLKEDSAEFAEKWRVSRVIEKYSNFVMFPISIDGAVVNRSSALWRLPRSQVTPEQHAEFFKLITDGAAGDAPRLTVHYAVDAPVQFHALVYVPVTTTHEMLMPQQKKQGLRLYARRVLIMESCDKLLPPYLRFLRGVVDSEDLDLNVSRETLQDNRSVRQIEQQLTRQVLKGLTALAKDDPESYSALWRTFGIVIKEGITIDWKNKDELATLCRFSSLMCARDEVTSLAAYVARAPEAQSQIFYLTGVDLALLDKSPLLEAFRARGIDVLLMTDPVDEWVMNALPEFGGKKLVSVAHGEVDLDAIAPPKEVPVEDADLDELVGHAVRAVGRVLSGKVESVRASRRLTETASCLVARDGEPSANLVRLMKMMDENAMGAQQRILELNPNHPMVRNIGTLAARDPESTKLVLYGEMLFEQALLGEGVVEDPARLARRIQELLLESTERAVS
ncbi:MAG: molecular chaperone HtpG [Myxococcales bacterium]|nr:molecular chaperone HtpG [Myxococcales bacterium]